MPTASCANSLSVLEPTPRSHTVASSLLQYLLTFQCAKKIHMSSADRFLPVAPESILWLVRARDALRQTLSWWKKPSCHQTSAPQIVLHLFCVSSSELNSNTESIDARNSLWELLLWVSATSLKGVRPSSLYSWAGFSLSCTTFCDVMKGTASESTTVQVQPLVAVMLSSSVSAVVAGCKQRAKQAASVQWTMINATGVDLNESDRRI